MGENNGMLGTIVSWRVPGEIGLAALRTALQAAGFEPDLARDMLPRNALKRALRNMSEGRVIRALREEPGICYFQLTRENRDPSQIHYVREAEVHLDLGTGHLGGDRPDLVAEARTLMDEHLAKRITTDLTRLVQTIFDRQKAELVPIRDQGGVYFVPAKHAGLVESTRKLLEAIAGKLRTFEVRLGSAETSESVAEAMSEHLAELIRELLESCEHLDAGSRDDMKLRRLERAAEIRSKLECYQGLLAGYAETIQIRLQEAEKSLLAKIAGVEGVVA